MSTTHRPNQIANKLCSGRHQTKRLFGVVWEGFSPTAARCPRCSWIYPVIVAKVYVRTGEPKYELADHPAVRLRKVKGAAGD